jgi:hypothetical protein
MLLRAVCSSRVVFTLSRLHESKYLVIYYLKKVHTSIMADCVVSWHKLSLRFVVAVCGYDHGHTGPR